MPEFRNIINNCNVLRNSFSECCHYSRHNICVLFSSHRITPDALYRRYALFTRDSDKLYRKLLIYFMIELDIFVTINTHTHTHTHTLGHALAYRIRLHATSRKVAGSRPIGVNKCSISVIIHSAQGLGVYSTFNRNEYQKQKINVCGE
jgi:hypothetical protein